MRVSCCQLPLPPVISSESALNLFVRDMPRLSVDIDRTYVEISPREEALAAINEGLLRVKNRIEAQRPNARIIKIDLSRFLRTEDLGVLGKNQVAHAHHSDDAMTVSHEDVTDFGNVSAFYHEGQCLGDRVAVW